MADDPGPDVVYVCRPAPADLSFLIQSMPMLSKRLSTFAVLWVLLISGAAGAVPDALLSVKDAMKRPILVDMELSPDGKYIAAIGVNGESSRAILIDTATLVSRFLIPESKYQTNYDSVSWFNERMLVVAAKGGPGIRWVDIVDLEGKEVINSGNEFIGKVNPDKAGNSRFVMGRKDGTMSRVTVATGEDRVVNSGMPGEPVYSILDAEGDVRVVITVSTAFWSDDTSITYWYRASKDQKWEKLATFPYLSDYWIPLQFTEDGKALVVASSQGRDTIAYFRYDLAERKLGEMMVGHPTQDVYADFENSEKETKYVMTRGMKPQVEWFDAEWAALQRSVDAAIPDHINLMQGDRKKLVLIFSYSDTDPGQWLLLDVPKATLRLVANSKPEINVQKMRPMQIVNYKARDGLTIPAYLTLPALEGPKPTIVYIHGGPRARDGWRWDPEVQMLASRGYAVFQPQFRGSAGFGKRFMEAGFGQWGLSMQDDITDGVHWLIENGYADPARICIFGASYGGYAALWGLVKTPELYRCGASFAGVSDIGLILKDDTDTNSKATGRLALRKMVGRDQGKQVFDDVSPLRNASRIMAPVLIAHGEWDQRVPIWHSTKMVSALRNSGKEVEWLELEKEGHGIYYEANQELFFTALFKLFDRTIGAGAPAVKPATRGGSATTPASGASGTVSSLPAAQ
jgi:dipeptidyl aminopeptidase/acylaminoacyl peptidase